MALRIEKGAEPLPGYRLIERIGGGGFGDVWKAEAPGGLFKAIKFVFGNIDSVDEEGARAEQELKALKRVAGVRHPYVLSLERYDILEGQLVIVMELADKDLWDRFKECRDDGKMGIPRQELLLYMREAAEALDMMNIEFDLQHLDIKPQNIFLVHNHAKVADFGLIKDLKGTLASVTGGVTPVYAAPETFDGQVSRATDQYSLAIVFQELLTGKRPFAGTTARQLVLQHMQGEPDLAPLPPKDRTVVRKALHKEYAKRYKTCREFIEALIARDAAVDGTTSSFQQTAGQDGDQTTGSGDFPSSTGKLPSLGPDSTKGLTPFGVPPYSQPATKPGIGTASLSELDAGAGEATQRHAKYQVPLKLDDWEADTDSDVHFDTLSAPEEDVDSPLTISPDGILVPALVIGLGSCGQALLRNLRAQLQERFGCSNPTPHIRFLYMDTDSEAIQQATQGGDDAVRHSEIFHLRLHRAAHYLKKRDFTKQIASWLPKDLLYQIPRQHVAAGHRPLGRLAFIDQSGSVYKRLQTEIKACRSHAVLCEANRNTTLNIASTQPRVIIAAGLGGGTGSGVIIDLAYVTRHLLKKMGLANSEVLGMFLLSQPGQASQSASAQANVYAALTELHHFSEPDAFFTANYPASNFAAKNSSFRETGPAYHRCLLAVSDGGATTESKTDLRTKTDGIKQAANLLFTELCTPVGRSADKLRANDESESEIPKPRTVYQIAGARRIASPRKQLLRRGARRLCGTLVNHWMSKDAGHLREGVQQWVAQNWSELEISSDELIHKLQAACKKELGENLEQWLHKVLEPIRTAEGEPNDNSQGPPVHLNIGMVIAALQEIEQLVGVPEGCAPLCGTGSAEASTSGRVNEILKETSARINRECDKRIAELAVRLIEQPVFRLAGAEETLRQFSTIVQDSLEHQESLAQELKERATGMYNRILELLDRVDRLPKNPRTSWSLPFSKRASPGRQELSVELWELLQKYPKIRFQSLVMQHTGGFFLGLRGLLSDHLSEVNFCRQRLHEMTKLFADDSDRASGDKKKKDGRQDSLGRVLLPSGCNSLEEAVDQCVGQISADEFIQLDHTLEKVIRKKFRALVNVCLNSTNVLAKTIPVLEGAAQAFLKSRIGDDDVIQIYLDEQGKVSDEELIKRLNEFFAEAAPDIAAPSKQKEQCFLALPESPDREEFEDAAKQALEQTDVHITDGVEDILVYRVSQYNSPAELEQLTKEAKQAYKRLTGHEHFTPHSRADVPIWNSLDENSDEAEKSS